MFSSFCKLYTRLIRRHSLRLCVLLAITIIGFICLMKIREKTRPYWPSRLVVPHFSFEESKKNKLHSSESTYRSNSERILAHLDPMSNQIKDSATERQNSSLGNVLDSNSNIFPMESIDSKLQYNRSNVNSEVKRYLQMISDFAGDKAGINIPDVIVENKTEMEQLERSCKTWYARRRFLIHNKIVRNFTLQKNDTKDDFINLHRFGYVTDSKVCQNDPPQVIILIHSKFNNFIKRTKIRKTWAFNKTVLGLQIQSVFILGQPSLTEIDDEINGTSKKVNKTVEEKKAQMAQEVKHLEVEVKLFGDIVIGNFTDSYRNLTIKHVMALSWVLSHCPTVQYVAKVDDDVVVNTYTIATIIKNNTETNGFLMCHIPEGRHVIRRKTNKWFVTKAEYPFNVYPPWCLGLGIFMTRDVAKKLYETSRDMRPFWIDDVYVTGLLAWRAGITLTRMHVRSIKYVDMPLPNLGTLMFLSPKFKGRDSHVAFWKNIVQLEADIKHE